MEESVSALLDWYRRNARDLPWRHTSDPYRIWVSEIMLQQTRAETVIPYYARFLERWPDCRSLSEASVDEVLKMWQGLGYYSRGRNLLAGAKYIRERYGEGMPASFRQWLEVPGAGRYTAAAVASIALGEPVAAVDGNVLRAAARFFAIGEDIAKPAVRRRIEERLTPLIPPEEAGTFTQAMIELGACVCRPAARCEICPLADTCQAKKLFLTDELPVKSRKPAQRAVRRGVLMALWEDEVLLHKRPDTGLLAGLWEFPAWEAGEAALPGAWGWPEKAEHALFAQHVFTHVRWEMEGFVCRIANKRIPPGAYEWAKLDELDRYAVPTAMRAFTRYLAHAESAGV